MSLLEKTYAVFVTEAAIKDKALWLYPNAFHDGKHFLNPLAVDPAAPVYLAEDGNASFRHRI